MVIRVIIGPDDVAPTCLATEGARLSEAGSRKNPTYGEGENWVIEQAAERPRVLQIGWKSIFVLQVSTSIRCIVPAPNPCAKVWTVRVYRRRGLACGGPLLATQGHFRYPAVENDAGGAPGRKPRSCHRRRRRSRHPEHRTWETLPPSSPGLRWQ
jgi:hypothetical protein